MKTIIITAALGISILLASCGQKNTETSHAENAEATHEQVVINTPDDALAVRSVVSQRLNP